MRASARETTDPARLESIAELIGAGFAPELAGDDLHLWLLPLPVGDADLRRTIEELPAAAERAGAARLVFAADRLRQVHARGLLRLLLGNYLARDPRGLSFVTNAYGKPLLSQADGLHFNLSHCQDRVLIGVTRRAPVGVDVERIRSLPDRDALAAHCCSVDEQNWLAGRPANRRERDFLRLWTAKEAILKALGTGLATPPESVSVSLPAADTGFAEVTGAGSPWTLLAACPDADHTIALGVRTTISGERIRCFDCAREISQASIRRLTTQG